MKSLTQYISEGYAGWPKGRGNDKMYFTSMEALALFLMELLGQCSDGKFENSRPSNHWIWVMNTDYILDPNHEPGYYGENPHKLKNYNINEWISYTKKGADYDWAKRIYAYVKFASIINESDWKKLVKQADYLGPVLEHITPDTNTVAELLEKNKNLSYLTQYVGKADLINDENIKKFNEAKDISEREMRGIMQEMNETVNTYLGQLSDDK